MMQTMTHILDGCQPTQQDAEAAESQQEQQADEPLIGRAPLHLSHG